MRYSDAPVRRAEIVNRVSLGGYVSSAQLAAELGVSEMTIRRDVRQLASDGLVRQVVGGATLPSPVVPFDERRNTESSLKQAIAEACLPLLAGATTIALDAGTTVAPLAARIEPGTTVVSHSVPVLTACTSRDDLDLIGVGGTYQPVTRSFTGPATRSALESLAVDVAVLSATAVDGAAFFSTDALDAETKRVMASVSATTILLADSTKLGQRARIRVGPLSLIDILVTDSGAPRATLDELRAAGLRVVIADTVGTVPTFVTAVSRR